ncbi:MAG: hypothetical protein HPY76_11250, partial [Anaerolineae bacterium]|nr:hypothetical protein [Anaerolineae bacterium]
MPEQRNLDRRAVIIFLPLSTLEGLLTVIAIGLINPDPKNAWLLGFSKQRLMMMAAIFAIVLAFAALLVWMIRKPLRVEAAGKKLLAKRRLASVLTWLFGLAFALGLALALLPAYRSGALQAYFLRLRPVIIWFTLVCGQALLLLLLSRYGIDLEQWRERRRSERSLFVFSMIVFGAMLLIWLLVAWTGLGIKPDSAFWNQAGTPLMGIQLLIAWWSAFLLWRVADSVELSGRKRLDIITAIVIWLLAVLVWKFTPFFGDYFASGLHAPNFEHYPASDAQVFDVSAQFALIGQGYANSSLVSRPFFTFFLTSIYTLFGNDIDTIINAQIMIYALIPVILYGLGLEYGKRPAGLFAGLMLVFIEGNAIATSHIVQRTNARLLMTEMPAALMLIGITWLLTRWWHAPERRWGLIPLAGGILGFSTMVRQNTWALLLAIPVFAGFALWRQRRSLGKFLIWFVLGFFAAIAPWMVRSAVTTGNPLYILGPFRYVVWGNRLSDLVETTPTLPPAARLTPDPDASTLTPTEAILAQTPTYTGTPEAQFTQQPPSTPPGGGALTLAGVVSNHYAHNLVASSLVFPPRLLFHDIFHLMDEPDSYWQLDWQGQIDGERIVFLTLALAVLALGIGSAWRSRRAVGLLPLWMWLSYHGGTAIARTSGGRYIVPVEWVLPLYFALGAWLMTLWGADLFKINAENETADDHDSTDNAVAGRTRPPFKPWLVCMLLLAFGALMTTADRFG